MHKPVGKSQAEIRVSSILSEEVLTLSQACEAIHETLRKKPSRATLCRWIHSGQLEAVRFGRILLTSREAIHRWLVDRTATLRIHD
jgi:excisionase family DNA binding protein